MDPITGPRSGQMNGQAASRRDGPAQGGPTEEPGGSRRNGTPKDSAVPERSHVPPDTGRRPGTRQWPGHSGAPPWAGSGTWPGLPGTGSSAADSSHLLDGLGSFKGPRVPDDHGGRGRAGAGAGLSDPPGAPPGPGRDTSPEPERPEQAPGRSPSQRRLLPLRRARIGHLARDGRVPAWRSRLLIAVAVGVLFAVWLNWRVGLTVAVLAAILDTVIRSRTTAASVAEGLTSSAQRQTKRQLSGMERAGYRALHIRAIPGSDQVIDHLLIGPTGVYAIDSEQWDKRLAVRTKNGRQLWHGPFSQKERLDHARWEAQQASKLIGQALGEQVTVRPAMAVYGPAIPWGIAKIRDVDVFAGDRLRKYLRRPPQGARGPDLSASEVARIYTAAERTLPPVRRPAGG